MLERRKEQRWPAYLGGVIVLACRESTADCLIRSTSPSGARLVLRQAALLPDEFSLQIPNKQTEMRVRTCWRRFHEIGVETVPEHKAVPIDLALVRQLKRLEAHNIELKRRVFALSEPQL
jgi:hypothetical protein